jgi:uncharacterized membrane protein YdjX (TVP38/TMEM64 family)
MKRGTIKFVILIVFLLAVFFSIRFFGLQDYLDQEKLRGWINGFGVLGPAVYMLLYSVAPAFLLPGLPMTVLGGILFGPVWGVVYASIGGTAGAAVAFLVARYMGREWVEGRIKASRFKDLDMEVLRG